jgi:hypothetical protein
MTEEGTDELLSRLERSALAMKVLEDRLLRGGAGRGGSARVTDVAK